MGCVRGHVGAEPRSVVLTMHYFSKTNGHDPSHPVLSAAHLLTTQTDHEKNCRRRRCRRRRIAGKGHVLGRVGYAWRWQAAGGGQFDFPAEALTC